MNHDEEVFGPLPKKKEPVFYHPFGLELYDATAMDLYAVKYAEQCVKAERERKTQQVFAAAAGDDKGEMKTKHTPGPWTKSDRLNGPWWHISGAQTEFGRQALACVHGESKRGAKAYAEMFEANARLIAAAPDLLEAAAEAERVIEILWASHHANRADAALDALRAAIAKATGDQP